MVSSMLITLVIAILSGMGVGGGGMFVIYLSLFTDTPQLVAQGMTLLFFLLSSGASVTVHLRDRRICYPAVGVMAVAGILGALFGSFLISYVPQALLRRIFGMMLTASGIIALLRREEPVRER